MFGIEDEFLPGGAPLISSRRRLKWTPRRSTSASLQTPCKMSERWEMQLVIWFRLCEMQKRGCLCPEKHAAQVSCERPFRCHKLRDHAAPDRRAEGGKLRRARQEHRTAAGASGDLWWAAGARRSGERVGALSRSSAFRVQVVPKVMPEMPQRSRTSRSLKATSAAASLFPSTWCSQGSSPVPRWRPPTSKLVREYLC